MKNILNELPHELPKDLRLRIFGDMEISEKCQNWMEIEPSAKFFSRKNLFRIPILNYSMER